MTEMRNIEPSGVEVENCTEIGSDSTSAVSRLWLTYKKITVFPAQMPRSQSAGKAAYVLMSAIALYMVISITLTEKLYTDVNEQPTVDHVLPDLLWCPFAPSAHLREATSDIVNSTRNPFARKYMVWYMRNEVETLNMTDEQLDALAGYVKNGHIESGLRADLLLKVEMSKEMSLNVSKFGPNYEMVAEYYENRTDPDDLYALWALLARPASYDKLHGGPFQCYPVLRGTVNDSWCKLAAESVWVNNAYCVLFPFQSLNLWLNGAVGGTWNIKHYMFNWDHETAMKITEGLGVKTWMGNIQMQRLSPEDMWTLYPKEKDQFSHVNYKVYKLTDFERGTSTVCQDKKIFTGNSRFDNCQPHNVNSYWMFKFSLWGSGFDLNPWFIATSVTYMTNKSSLSTIQRVQLYGGVFGFTTGLSVLQLIALLTMTLKTKRNINRNVIRLGELCVIIVMFVGGAYLATDNMLELLSNSRFVRTSQYERLMDNSIIPHIVISQANIVPMTMLNHTKLEQYNVSLMMLRYLTAISGVSLYDSWSHAVFFFDAHKEQKPLNLTVKNLIYDLLVFEEVIEGENRTEFNPRNSRNLFTDQMNVEFGNLAERLSLSKDTPPYKVYDHFRIDLCELIKFCRYKKNTSIENCCQYARYESFHYHRIADAITIRFPAQYTIDSSGDSNGIEVYFDPEIFKESNFQYAGPQHNKFIRQIDLSRRGLLFSYVRVYLFEGKETERRASGYTTVNYDVMECAGKLHNGGFTFNKVIRLVDNEENECRQVNRDCELLGYENAMDAMARAVAEKTMCNCHICHSVPHNNVIAELWRKNGCCTALQASSCLKRPITCCLNGAQECCFHPVMNRNQICTAQGRFVQTLLFNRRAESMARCSPEYEIVSPDAAASGSVVAAQLSTSDRHLFTTYNATCIKSVCERTTFTNVRTDDVSNTDSHTSTWFGIRIFLSMDYLLTSVEEDRFSAIEAVIQLFGGFGLLFGMSLLTVFEMVSASANLLHYTFFTKRSEVITEKQSAMSTFRRMLVGRTLRSVDVFLTQKDNETNDQLLKKASTLTSKTKVFAAPLDVAAHQAVHVPESSMSTPPQKSPKEPLNPGLLNTMESDLPQSATGDEKQKTNHVNATPAGSVHASVSLISLAFGISLAGYAMYVLIAQISANNIDAKFDVSFNGVLTPPSMAFCVLNKDYEQLVNLTKYSMCARHDSMLTPCVNHFNIRLRNAEETCLVKDETQNSRNHGNNLRRFEDYSIVFPTAQNQLKQVHIWFGDASAVRKGRLSPTEPLVLGKSIDVIYTLLRSIRKKQCKESIAVISCIQCELIETRNETGNQCCLQQMQGNTVNLSNESLLEPCIRNYYSVTTKVRVDQNSGATAMLRVIDEYGVVDVVTQEERQTWPIILSSLGTVVDTFVGVTLLNVLCACIVLISSLIQKD